VIIVGLVVAGVAIQSAIAFTTASRYKQELNRSIDRYVELDEREAQVTQEFAERESAAGFRAAMQVIHDGWRSLETESEAIRPPRKRRLAHQLFTAALAQRVMALEELIAHPGSGEYAKRLTKADDLCLRAAKELGRE